VNRVSHILIVWSNASLQ